MEQPATEELWQAARAEVLETLGGLAGVLGGNPAHAVGDYLLFTTIGAVVTPRIARCFSSGDGLFIVNGVPHVIGPFPDNAPPYLAYALLEEDGEKYRFELQPALPAEELRSLLLGTDGAEELLALERSPAPGKGARFGAASRLWTDDRIFDQPDALRRLLFDLARDEPRPDGENRELLVDPGLLTDDATVVVLRRAREDAKLAE